MDSLNLAAAARTFVRCPCCYLMISVAGPADRALLAVRLHLRTGCC